MKSGDFNVTHVIKRDGSKEEYDSCKIWNAVKSVVLEVGNGYSPNIVAEEITEMVEYELDQLYGQGDKLPSVERIQDLVEEKLMKEDYHDLAKAYILYREKRKQEREGMWLNKDVPIMIWSKKYQYDGEGFEEHLDRVTNGNRAIKKMMKRKKVCPAGRILANRQLSEEGYKVTYSNCYVNEKPQDNLESIFDTAKQIARVFSYGGGTGFDISNLRARGMKVRNSAKKTTGAVSFMDLYGLTSGLIGQDGRRAALMIMLSVEHPDIVEFIRAKEETDRLTGMNISVKMTDNFMEKYEEGESIELKYHSESTGETLRKEVDTEKIMNMLAHNNWLTGEPGVIYWNRVNNWSLLSEVPNFEFGGTNPCGEEPLPEGGSCLLGSINLAEFVKRPFTDEAEIAEGELKSAVREMVRYLNEVLDEGLDLHPLDKQKQVVRDWRQIGLGIMGLADLFIKKSIKYGSQESINISDRLGRIMINTALQESAKLAKENGKFPMYDERIMDSEFFKANANEKTKEMVEKYGLRNSQLLTIAPTGSISNVYDVAGGIEPLFDISYTRKIESFDGETKEYPVIAGVAKEYMEKEGIQDLSKLPDYFVTARDIYYRDRIAIQKVWQKHVDASISSTINLDRDTTVEEVKDLYVEGWREGLKGVTVFREGCKRDGVLTSDGEKGKKYELTDSEMIEQNICPDCFGQIINTGGCKECKCCGFSACSV